MIETDIAIIGGGLTGLTLQYLLRNENRKTIIIEARDRVGGRIHTVRKEHFASIEMGATWLQTNHTQLQALLKELGIAIFPQEMGSKAIYEASPGSPAQLVLLPENESPSYRIKGGTSKLISTLAEYLKPDQLYLDQIVQSIAANENDLVIQSNTNTFKAKIVVSTIPPFLLKKTINIHPDLPTPIFELMEKTHTWMGESIKFGLCYKEPFWRKNNLTGTVFCNGGPIQEMYDHSSFTDNLYALKGFLNNSYHALTKAERLNLVLNQLKKYYGKEVDSYLSYEEVVWRKEKHTFAEYDSYISPHQNNGHPMYQQAYLNGKLYIAGAETSRLVPGYMEGAVYSAQTIAGLLQAV